jgi:hypothetical protein
MLTLPPNASPFLACERESAERTSSWTNAEHNLAKVGVEGSNPFASSNTIKGLSGLLIARPTQ